MPKITLKTILAGEGAVGKTSLVTSFMHQKFSHDYKITVGMNVASKVVIVDGHEVTFSLFDIAGQERFGSVRSAFFKGTQLVLLVFDLTRKETLAALRKNWIESILELNPAGVESILIGNKSDLKDLRILTSEDGKKFFTLIQKTYPAVHLHSYIETSAINNENVDASFTLLAKAFLKKNPP